MSAPQNVVMTVGTPGSERASTRECAAMVSATNCERRTAYTDRKRTIALVVLNVATAESGTISSTSTSAVGRPRP
jgi:hypothetical protein